ncbi:MAG: hypothetical protein NTW87_21710 [Planctomycetota bacterium]|nr:hypothetical protein [Planctomycetota bacterium]
MAVTAEEVSIAADGLAAWLITQYDTERNAFGAAKEGAGIACLSMVVRALCDSQRRYRKASGRFIAEPLKRIVSQVAPDGLVNGTKSLEDYVDVALALRSAGDPDLARVARTVDERLTCLLNAIGFADEDEETVSLSYWEIEHACGELELNPTQLARLRDCLEAVKRDKRKRVWIRRGRPPWALLLAEALLKRRLGDGTFGGDVQANALALQILNVCYNEMRNQ